MAAATASTSAMRRARIQIASTATIDVQAVDDQNLRNIAAAFNDLVVYCRKKSRWTGDTKSSAVSSSSSSSSSVQTQIASAVLVVDVDGIDENSKFWPIVVAFNEIIMHFRGLSKSRPKPADK
jgi:hypothetical protein